MRAVVSRVQSASVTVDDEVVGAIDAGLLVLLGVTRKGRRPSWGAGAPGPVAEPVVEQVVAALRGEGLTVETGRFGARMQVASVNDGPFTVLVEV